MISSLIWVSESQSQVPSLRFILVKYKLFTTSYLVTEPGKGCDGRSENRAALEAQITQC